MCFMWTEGYWQDESQQIINPIRGNGVTICSLNGGQLRNSEVLVGAVNIRCSHQTYLNKIVILGIVAQSREGDQALAYVA